METENMLCKSTRHEGKEVIGVVKDNFDWCFMLVPFSKKGGNQSMNFDSCFIVRVVDLQKFR